MNAPAARPFAGEGSPAAKTDRANRDDLFARMLDEDRSARDLEKGSDIAPPALAPVETPARPEPVEASDEDAGTDPVDDDQTAAAADQRSEPNSLNSEDGNAATTGDGGAEGSTNGDAASAKQLVAAPTDGALLILANASGAPGAQVTNADETDALGETGTAREASPEGAGVLALAGIVQPAVAQAAASGESSTAKPATIDAAGSPPIPTDMVEDAGATPAASKDGKHSDAAQPQSANPAAASQPNSPSAASAATQANAVAAAATANDGAAQASSNAGNAATQAAAQPASTANPLTDATRAVATPPALQSAPAATIQVYSRIIERADGRAQRFEVRLDPAELGRVDIRIEIGADRKVHAVMAAHDSAALTDLMRGQKALERALSEAGIDLADQGLKFEMSSDAGRGNASQQRDSDGRTSQPVAWRKFDTASIPVSTEAAAVATPTRRTQRLDLVA